MGFTAHQFQAISAEGDVLLLAGAGTGKTETLTQRCIERLRRTDVPTSLDRILMVTFTDAAARGLRHRIRLKLQELLKEPPGNARLAEQLALLDSAPIGTLHGFCLRLIREHFDVLGLDPQLQVLDETQAHALAAEALDTLLQRHYQGKGDADREVQELVVTYGKGWDDNIRRLIRRVHDYSRTLPDPEAWLDAQQRHFEQPQPEHWLTWLLAAVKNLRNDWLADLQVSPWPNLQRLAGDFARCPDRPTRADAVTLVEAVQSANQNWGGRKKKPPPEFEPLFSAASFLAPLAKQEDTNDPLLEDWSWLRPQMLALVGLVREFGAEFEAAKRQNAALDFHDLEQFALRLLWDREADAPSAIARHWRDRLDYVFVDEYQDINAAQDRIITALSREGPGANRFLVGDVKQCIYRFRLANPHIFQRYAEEWSLGRETGRRSVIPLTDNFRSREAILEFVNEVFAALMRHELGGVKYDKDARLRFGQTPARAALGLQSSPPPAVELLLRITRRKSESDPAEEDDAVNLTDLEREARDLGLRLRQLREERSQVWDGERGRFRAAEWSDMVVLLRAPSGRAEIFAQEFGRLGIPLSVAGGEFYAETEISDLMSLLTLLDNPLQDAPVIAVLRSPLAGLTLDELALVRLAQPQGRFWLALQRLLEKPQACSPAQTKVASFLEAFARWRRLARQASLSQCLETILDETNYEDWLLAQPRGTARRANVQRLLALTRRFDMFQRQGLHRFQQFVAAQREAEASPEPSAPETQDCVRLMSIHQSKGLEFPIVAVAALGVRFNLSTGESGVLLDEHFGLCARIQPPGHAGQYPSLPYHLANERQRREALGEELRLLYVSMTRACDRLILAGSVPEGSAQKWPTTVEPTPLSLRELLRANNPLGWLGRLVARLTGRNGWLQARTGQGRWLEWRITSNASVAGCARDFASVDDGNAPPTSPGVSGGSTSEEATSINLEPLRQRLTWRYAHPSATREPAKSSVSALRRRLNEADEEARPFLNFTRQARTRARSAGTISAAEIGVAHHRFLEHLDWDRALEIVGLQAETERQCKGGILSLQEAAALDLPSIAAFFQSEFGQRLRSHAALVKRELEFTARFSLAELGEIGLIRNVSDSDEFVVIQGVADLVAVLPDALWIVDFKTDQIEPVEVEARLAEHRKQLRVYARAMERIFNRPAKECAVYFLALRRSEFIRLS